MATISLVELARCVGTREVEVGGGRTLSVRGLAGWEFALLNGIVRRPEPPQIPDPDKGSASEDTVPDFDDPAFRLESERWYHRHRIVCVAAATNHAANGLRWEDVRGKSGDTKDKAQTESLVKWCEAALADLDGIGPKLAETMYAGVLDASSPAALVETAIKN